MQEAVSRNISRNSYKGPTTMDPCDQDTLVPSNFSHVSTLTLAMSLWVCHPVKQKGSLGFVHLHWKGSQALGQVAWGSGGIAGSLSYKLWMWCLGCFGDGLVTNLAVLANGWTQWSDLFQS